MEDTIKKEILIKDKWEDITIEDFINIKDIFDSDMTFEEKYDELLSVVSGLSYQEVRQTELITYNKLLKSLDFITKEIPKIPIKDKITINGKKFNIVRKLSNIKTGQYLSLDYLNKLNDFEGNLHKYCAIFLIPDGKTYGKDYDVEEIETFLLKNMNIVDGYSVFFYLSKLSLKLLKSSLSFLEKMK